MLIVKYMMRSLGYLDDWPRPGVVKVIERMSTLMSRARFKELYQGEFWLPRCGVVEVRRKRRVGRIVAEVGEEVDSWLAARGRVRGGKTS